ncbi:uncharacterized protein LOC113851555 [Abrus precatorius]|uniref:Uncharacterized protein LOC113851555 n=1 Tax=Abrus precatorius TaxID=3816 RepID=A0A8B8K3D2_ABRPR|nr:uncharacterized protein LOC113851555 [Abrus precatorius]
MGLSRRSVSDTALLLLGLLLFTYNLDMALASSGGVMGGNFFSSDSESSSSESYTSDSESQMVLHDNHPTSHDAELASGSHGGVSMFFLIFIFGLFLVGFCKDTNGNTVTVLKLQVAMSGGMGSSIQRDLTRIAETADTSSREETMQSLDRHHGHCISGYSSVDLKRSKGDGEKFYNQLSNEERAKFDEETLVNLNNTEKKSTKGQNVDLFSNEYSMFDAKERKEERYKFEEEKLLSGFGNEYIVITILVAAKGAHKFPNINGAEDLKEASQKLRSLLSSKLLAGEVLWTPQNEEDTLSKRKLLEDYPQLAKGLKSFQFKKHE